MFRLKKLRVVGFRFPVYGVEILNRQLVLLGTCRDGLTSSCSGKDLWPMTPTTATTSMQDL